MKMLAILVFLTGCQTIGAQLPSVQNCQRVTYVREYSEVKLYAECDVAKSGTVR
jgi:hypothetical protein